MEIIRADILGFCSGVRRAVNTAEVALSSNEIGQVWSLGPLIHNPTVLDNLEERGLKIMQEDDRVSALDTVIIRAHGIPPKIARNFRETAGQLIDATCPLVMQSQKRASEYARRGYSIIFAGDKGHGEVVGIEGFAHEGADKYHKPTYFYVVKNAEELVALYNSDELDKSRKAVLLSQTTFSPTVFEEIRQEFVKLFWYAKVVCSICPATTERQNALEKLCKEVDGVLVIGGKTSANTNRLFATALEHCKNAALIESAKEIPDDFRKLARVGITAGASTPDSVILAVEKSLKYGS